MADFFDIANATANGINAANGSLSAMSNVMANRSLNNARDTQTETIQNALDKNAATKAAAQDAWTPAPAVGTPDAHGILRDAQGNRVDNQSVASIAAKAMGLPTPQQTWSLQNGNGPVSQNTANTQALIAQSNSNIQPNTVSSLSQLGQNALGNGNMMKNTKMSVNFDGEISPSGKYKFSSAVGNWVPNK